jgi:hypothetical protein
MLQRRKNDFQKWVEKDSFGILRIAALVGGVRYLIASPDMIMPYQQEQIIELSRFSMFANNAVHSKATLGVIAERNSQIIGFACIALSLETDDVHGLDGQGIFDLICVTVTAEAEVADAITKQLIACAMDATNDILNLVQQGKIFSPSDTFLYGDQEGEIIPYQDLLAHLADRSNTVFRYTSLDLITTKQVEQIVLDVITRSGWSVVSNGATQAILGPQQGWLVLGIYLANYNNPKYAEIQRQRFASEGNITTTDSQFFWVLLKGIEPEKNVYAALNLIASLCRQKLSDADRRGSLYALGPIPLDIFDMIDWQEVFPGITQLQETATAVQEMYDMQGMYFASPTTRLNTLAIAWSELTN